MIDQKVLNDIQGVYHSNKMFRQSNYFNMTE